MLPATRALARMCCHHQGARVHAAIAAFRLRTVYTNAQPAAVSVSVHRLVNTHSAACPETSPVAAARATWEAQRYPAGLRR